MKTPMTTVWMLLTCPTLGSWTSTGAFSGSVMCVYANQTCISSTSVQLHVHACAPAQVLESVDVSLD
eukprot:m.211560 g.211560  ORF g.211560 m.211560 type:complete len:67 (-) comp17151_c0_seq4:663-863(-)